MRNEYRSLKKEKARKEKGEKGKQKEKKNQCTICSIKLAHKGVSYKTSTAQPTIRAERVGPLRRIYQRFTLLPIFNADPHYTGTNTTAERNIDTRGRRGNSILRREFGITIPSHNGIVL